MSRLIFDIETTGEDYDALDETTQKVLCRWIKDSDESGYEASLKELKEGLGFSPLTGEIIAIGVLDPDKEKGTVFYSAPGEEFEEFEEDGIKFKQSSEEEMIKNFWSGAQRYDKFVSFNGRSFDVPFLMVRSAIRGIRPTKNLISNRYLNYQDHDAKHIDLFDQLTFYGAMRRKGGLHLWCRAFGIQSPKSEGISGDDVAELYKNKKYKDIARYNAGDLRATSELYRYWLDYFCFDN